MYTKCIIVLVAMLALTGAEDKKQTKRGIFGETFATGFDSGLSYSSLSYPQVTLTNHVAVPYAVPVVKHVAVPVDRHVPVPYPVYKTIAVPYAKPVAVPVVKHVAYPVYGSGNPWW